MTYSGVYLLFKDLRCLKFVDSLHRNGHQRYVRPLVRLYARTFVRLYVLVLWLLHYFIVKSISILIFNFMLSISNFLFVRNILNNSITPSYFYPLSPSTTFHFILSSTLFFLTTISTYFHSLHLFSHHTPRVLLLTATE